MKKGFACGVFDLFHAGHVLMLKECKEHCDYLVVAVNKAENINPEINPGKTPPIFTYEHRKMILDSCRFVDQTIGYNSEDELIEIMKNHKFDIRFLGEDYRGKKITGEDLIPEIYYTNRAHGLSTSMYKKKLPDNK